MEGHSGVVNGKLNFELTLTLTQFELGPNPNLKLNLS